MKKAITAVFIVCVLIVVGCLAFNAGRNYQAPESPEEAVSEETTIYEEPETLEESEDFDYSKILDGDFSDFAGEWKNGEGYTIDLKSDGTEGGGEDYYSVAEDIEYKDGYYNWGVIDYSNADNECWGGYAIWLYPVGVEIIDEYTGELITSDTTQVRLYAGQDFFPNGENIYYRQ